MTAEVTTTKEEWVVHELADIKLKDKRLEQRCQTIAKALAEHPNVPINQACEDWADTKAAYRFFANKKVEPAKCTAPHRQRTIERMKTHALVLALQDTTFFNYTHHPKTQELGEIGNKTQNQRGFGMHSTLAVTPTGTPLGLVTQAFFTRPIGAPAQTPSEARKLPIEEKESYRWLAAFEETLALAPAGTQVVTVCDREADIYEMFVAAQQPNAPLLVRASADRCLDEQAEVNKLWQKVGQQPIVGELSVEITGNQQQKARRATVAVRFTPVTLKPPWRPHQQKLPPVHLQAILVREEKPPAEIDEPIEWLLLTNTAVPDFEAAVRVVGWYCCRWQIEIFHKVIKSGCAVEDCRLQSAPRLQNFIALMSVVAWRLHWLTYLSRAQPDVPCTTALNTFEWQALYLRIYRSSEFPAQPPSIRQAVHWIARLGGFLGRKADGEPGVTVIWRGWQRLQDMADTWYLVNEHSQLVGNR